MSDQPAPIIIKRKKVIAGGHHGGAWKVAIVAISNSYGGYPP